MAGNTRDMIANVLTGAYWVPAQLTGLPAWNLTPDENKYMTDAVQTAIKSMGSKRSKKVLAALDKYMPGVSLAIAAAVITVPRINMTRAHYVQANNAKSRGPHRTQGDSGTGSAADAAARGNSGADSGGGTWSNINGGVRPLTATDLEGLG